MIVLQISTLNTIQRKALGRHNRNFAPDDKAGSAIHLVLNRRKPLRG